MLSSGEPLFSSIGAGATKLKPLKSWWAFALGGIPGESKYTQIINNMHARLPFRHRLKMWRLLTVLCCSFHGCRSSYLSKLCGKNARVRGLLFTFRRFSSELGVKAERVIWLACCRFKWGLQLSPVQFLQRTHRYELEKSNTAAGLKVSEHMWKWSQDPFQVNPPFPSRCNPGQPKASCWLLNTHTRLLVHTQQGLAACPDTHKHSWHGHDWWPAFTKPTVC